jgi:hypothetical protein
MTTLAQSAPIHRTGAWKTVVLYGFLQFAVYGVSAFLVEKYYGYRTQRCAAPGSPSGGR